MKKKGLIIATIVMVLVLAVSLTTATYAWFTVANQTTVESIDFTVAKGADVLIGLKTDNTYKSGAQATDFMYGQTTVKSGYTGESALVASAGTAYWEGGNPTLGGSIDMQLDLTGMKKAVGSGLVGASATALDYSTLRKLTSTSQAGPVAASGNGATADATTVERAIAQQNYLDVVIGVQPGASDLEQIYCNVTINPTLGVALGINAAIHVGWAIDGEWNGTNNVDIYGTANSYATLVSGLGQTLAVDYEGTAAANLGAFGGDEEVELNNGAVNLPILVAEAASGNYLSSSTIYQLHLIIWIDGTDPDCNNAALGVESTIYINFQGIAPSRA